MSYEAIRPLADAEVVHVVGDVHGHLEPLVDLMGHLGLDPASWPAGQVLVFVGDLTDRGPDSPGVVRLVGELIASGRAQLVLGNHEMKLLDGRGPSDSASNHWFWGEQTPGYPLQAVADEAMRNELRAILEPNPIALDSDWLRVIHAAWLDEPLATCSALRTESGGDLWRKSRRMIRAQKPDFYDDLQERLHDRDAGAPAMSAGDFAALQAYELSKDDHPAGRLLSGPKCGAEAFFWGAKWRLAQRYDWWNHYPADAPPVVFGHYWRRPSSAGLKPGSLWAAVSPEAWLGPGRSAYCVDFSVGYRGHVLAGEQTLAAVSIDRRSGATRLTDETGRVRHLGDLPSP